MRPTRPPIAGPSLRLLLAAAALALAGACGDTPTDSSGLGSLEITASTTGDDVDPDGYTVVLDGDESRSLGVDETITSSDVPAGRYVLELTGVAENCEVDGENPRTVRVSGGATASTTFDVVCGGRTGQARVTTTTSGDDSDTDGYTVTVDPDTDGAESRDVGTDDEATFTELGEGEHDFELTGVANQCSVEDGAERTVDVPFEGMAEIEYAVTCTSRTGDLEVSVSTTGEDQDDEYEVVVDETHTQTVAANDTVIFEGLSEGGHGVELRDVTSNCNVEGDPSRTVTVPFEGEASARFTVNCSNAVGSLEVTTTTTGQDPDPDGYEVVLDGDDVEEIAVDDTLIVDELPVGTRTVSLDGVASNCEVQENDQGVEVAFGDTASVGFQVACDDIPGDLEVVTSTTGDDPDDEYTVTLDPDEGSQSRTTGADDTTTFGELTSEEHVVELDGESVANNCGLADGQENPRTVTVPPDSTATTTFEIECTDAVGDLVVTTSTDGDEADLDPDGYEVVVDGTQTDSIGVSDTLVFEDLAEGEKSVELTPSSVAENCTVDSPNPQADTVPIGGEASVDFTLSCDAPLGDLEVRIATDGQDLDPDGYEVTVDPGPAELRRSVAVDDTTTFTNVEIGDHEVVLGDVVDNCSVDGSNADTVQVPFDETGVVTFDVSCVERTGSIEVTTETTGDDQDPDGYTVELDEGSGGAIGTNATETFTGIPEGTRTVTLAGVAANCEVQGGSQDVQVEFEQTETVTFTVECDDVPGDLQVSAATTGDSLDADGYEIALDPGTENADTLAIDDPNGSTTFTDLTSESHDVQIDESTVAENCTVESQVTHTVTVPEGGTEAVTFDVSCEVAEGSIEVTTTTTGVDQDPDGYTVQLDEGTGGAIGTNATETFTGIPEGTRTVTLAGVAENCEVQGGSQDVQVEFGQTETVTFTVECDDVPGDLQVSAATTGDSLDPDGYDVTVISADGTPTQTVGSNGTVTFTDLTSESHDVQIDESTVAENCTVESQVTQTVTVPEGGTEAVTFDVSCEAAEGSIEVTTTTTGVDQDPDGYTVEVDGDSVGTIGVGGTQVFGGVPEGTRTVSLAGVAENCEVQGGSQEIQVAFDSTSTVGFTVDCDDISGDLDVSAETTGTDQDTDGYTVTVISSDTTPSQTVPSNGTATFAGLSSQAHDVQIDESTVADNCTVDSDTTQTVTVPAGGTATVTFNVSCDALGELRVFTSTTGDDQDSDGYTVQVDPTGGPSEAMAANDTTVFADLTSEDHVVELDPATVTTNCTVDSANPDTIAVPPADTAAKTFAVSCVAQE